MTKSSKRIISDIGCSQMDHLKNCGHFGYTGEYQSRHSDDCDYLQKVPVQFGFVRYECSCNPAAWAEARGEVWTGLSGEQAKQVLSWVESHVIFMKLDEMEGELNSGVSGTTYGDMILNLIKERNK